MSNDDGLYLGLISGTSADGIDAALVRFDEGRPSLVAGLTHPWDDTLRRRILAVAQDEDRLALDDYGRLDVAVAHAFTDAAQAVLERARVSSTAVKAIGSHGQTIRHRPDGPLPFTLQIGDPSVIAERSGIDTIADFRRADVAAGGQGAPLVPAFHATVLRPAAGARAVLNLGGIANLTVVGTVDDPVLAYDSGPANCLLDVVATRAGIAEGYDVDGRLSSRGRVDDELLADMLTEPYFAQRPPKSTGRELFTPAWLDGHVAGRGIGGRGKAGRGIDDADLAATLVELTARTVADAIGRHGVDEVIASGGGVRNPVLADRLAALLRPVSMRSSDDLGLPADAKEAYLVALLGWLTWHGVPGVVPGATGSTRPRVLGRITPGDDPLRLPEPVPWIRALEIR